MNKIDTCQIKEITNQLIGYENFKMEEKMKKNKLRNIAFVFGGVLLLGISTMTVNALTNNAVDETIKKMIPFKVVSKNDEDMKNATCTELDNGNVSCTIEKESKDGDNKFEITVEYDSSYDKEKGETFLYEFREK